MPLQVLNDLQRSSCKIRVWRIFPPEIRSTEMSVRLRDRGIRWRLRGLILNHDSVPVLAMGREQGRRGAWFNVKYCHVVSR